MKKRPLFVFAGQSNMMGAAVYPATDVFEHKNSFEYKQKPRFAGCQTGEFTRKSHPCGEFIYTNEAMPLAYSKKMMDAHGNSYLNKYSENTYFCPAMANLKSDAEKTTQPFDDFSESDFQHGASLAPLLVREWERLGQSCAYTHITKGGVSISHFFSNEMAAQYENRITEYNAEHNTTLSPNTRHTPLCNGAALAFDSKVCDFFTDAKLKFPDEDTSLRALIWCQGENDALYGDEYQNYKYKLEVLWEHSKKLGFTHFFFVRIGFWEELDTREIMRAQEDFCAGRKDAYMLTRAMSFMPYNGMDESKFYALAPEDEYRNCRDSYHGFDNLHINQRGFQTVANHAIKTLKAVLLDNTEPTVEEEIVKF